MWGPQPLVICKAALRPHSSSEDLVQTFSLFAKSYLIEIKMFQINPSKIKSFQLNAVINRLFGKSILRERKKNTLLILFKLYGKSY